MLQDVEAGHPTELDALVGAVRELGHLTQVPTPFTDALFDLARMRGRVLGSTEPVAFASDQRGRLRKVVRNFGI